MAEKNYRRGREKEENVYNLLLFLLLFLFFISPRHEYKQIFPLYYLNLLH